MLFTAWRNEKPQGFLTAVFMVMHNVVIKN